MESQDLTWERGSSAEGQQPQFIVTGNRLFLWEVTIQRKNCLFRWGYRGEPSVWDEKKIAFKLWLITLHIRVELEILCRHFRGRHSTDSDLGLNQLLPSNQKRVLNMYRWETISTFLFIHETVATNCCACNYNRKCTTVLPSLNSFLIITRSDKIINCCRDCTIKWLASQVWK